MCFNRKTRAVPLFLFMKERSNKMNKKASIWSYVSVLIAAVLAVVAFARGSLQLWLLSGVFAAWILWIAVKYGIPYLKLQKSYHEARKVIKKNRARQTGQINFPDVSDSVSQVLVRHVNYRISAYLQSAYPDATWEWCEEFPERIARRGGKGRIRLFGVPEYNYADVSLTQDADIGFDLLKIVPITELQRGSEDTQTLPKKQEPVDPQVWYENQAKDVLKNLISCLASRGHHSLTIKENGEVSVKQADGDRVQAALKNVPERMYWARLSKVFEREGIAANITDAGMELSWL